MQKPKLRQPSKRYALQRDDIVAMRNATHVLITAQDMEFATIKLLKAVNEHDPTAELAEWSFNVTTSFNFIDQSLVEKTKAQVGFIFVNQDWEWQTFAAALQLSDELEVVWLPDFATNSLSLKAGLHGDMMKFIVYREDRRFHYRLGWILSKNDESRMIGPLSKDLTPDLIPS